jgi:hypothetical protein
MIDRYYKLDHPEQNICNLDTWYPEHPKYSYDGNILIVAQPEKIEIVYEIPHWSLVAGILFSDLFLMKIAYHMSNTCQEKGSHIIRDDIIEVRKEKTEPDSLIIIPSTEKVANVVCSKIKYNNSTFTSLINMNRDYSNSDLLKKIEDEFFNLIRSTRIRALRLDND